MTLEERLNSISSPKIENMSNVGRLPDGKADTVKEFFDTFVLPRLPDEAIIRGWHELLMDYTEDVSNVSCCIRFGNQRAPAGGTKWGEYGDSALRRGWITRNNADGFEYFYTDNHFCTYTCKMALCGFVPTLEEFSDAFHNYKFPYGFMFYLKNHPEVDGAVAAFGKNPGFSSNYKISHVFDAGAFFLVNGKIRNDAELSELYYPIGHSNDFLSNSDKIRKMDISDTDKQVIIAKFLRFAHPFNYFLTPTTKPKLHIYAPTVSIKNNDIGEDDRLLFYVRNYLKDKYPDIYKEFLEKTLWPYDPNITYPDTGSEYIGMNYGPHLKGSKSSTAASTKTPSVPKRVIDLSNINYTYLNSFKVGEIANQVLRTIIEVGAQTGKITKSDIIRFTSEKGATSTFRLTLPLLALDRFDTNGDARYYQAPISCYGKTLYLNSQWPKQDLRKKEALIQWIINWVTVNGSII
jgi:hypothetical protein